MREKLLFDDGWKFHKGDLNLPFPVEKGPTYTAAKTERMKWGPACRFYNDNSDGYEADRCLPTEKWLNVTLPHDYIISQTPNENENSALGYFKYENAWYSKTFTLKKEDAHKRITFFFEGIAVHATVYVNGCLLYHNFCGYNSFEVDITDYVLLDEENVIAIYVETDQHEGWWYEGGGIYRHVWLVKTDRVAVDLWGVSINPQKQPDDTWRVEIETTVLNSTESTRKVQIKNTLLDPKGIEVTHTEGNLEIIPQEKNLLVLSAHVSSPLLWDIDAPHLYHVKTEIVSDGGESDLVTDRFGFRTFSFDPDQGFFLNGKYRKIQGVCSHQDFGITGKAVPDNIYRYRIEMLKEMGANGYRTSHYPHSEATMDALDELGLVVMDETRWFDSSKEGKEQLEMLIKRDRNRPSVILWSVGNEEPLFITEQGRRICASLVAHVKKFDKSRPITAAVSNSPEIATVYETLDIIGINYNLTKFDDMHTMHPQKSIVSTECAATSSSRDWYLENSPVHGYMSSYDRDTNAWFQGRENVWKLLSERLWVAGGFQWIGFEHRGETVWPRLCSQAGAIDLFLQKKAAFYQNKSHWTHEPMAYIIPHWNLSGREGEEIPVYVYTNCEELELFQDGNSLGRKKIEPYGHGEWHVIYTPGKLSVTGYNKNCPVVEETVETAGKPQRLMLRLDNAIQNANGKDIAVITCYCVDEKGRFVPDASPYLTFSTNHLGQVVGTGSDVCDSTPVTSVSRRMRAGLCTAAVRVSTTAGKLKVYVQSENLPTASLEIELS